MKKSIIVSVQAMQEEPTRKDALAFYNLKRCLSCIMRLSCASNALRIIVFVRVSKTNLKNDAPRTEATRHRKAAKRDHKIEATTKKVRSEKESDERGRKGSWRTTFCQSNTVLWQFWRGVWGKANPSRGWGCCDVGEHLSHSAQRAGGILVVLFFWVFYSFG